MASGRRSNVIPELSIKLIVNDKMKKVIYASTDGHFVDTLSSILTLSLGTIVRELKRESRIGCIDQLYNSIESLDEGCFNTKACKVMILAPLNASRTRCACLKYPIDNSSPQSIFYCSNSICSERRRYFSTVRNTMCRCGRMMNLELHSNCEISMPRHYGAFVNSTSNYVMITDDLRIMYGGVDEVLSMSEQCIGDDIDQTEAVDLQFPIEKLLQLVKEALTSTTPFSNLYFGTKPNPEKNTINIPKTATLKTTFDTLSAHAVISKKTYEILYVIAGADFADLLFSFLTLPLGSIVELLSKSSSVGSLDALYSSIQTPSGEIFRPEAVESLLHPMLEPYFGLKHSLLSVAESNPRRVEFFLEKLGMDCCFMDYCFGIKHFKTTQVDPRLDHNDNNPKVGSYASGKTKFLITKKLEMQQYSLDHLCYTLKSYKHSTNDVTIKDFKIDRNDALKFLKACLTRPNPLDFLPVASDESSNRDSFGFDSSTTPPSSTNKEDEPLLRP